MEEWNWWFVSRRKTILSLLKNTDKKSTILDIGCAGGPLLNDLKNAGFENAAGADFSSEAVAKCKSRGLSAYEMDAHNLQFEPNSFDLLIASFGQLVFCFKARRKNTGICTGIYVLMERAGYS